MKRNITAFTPRLFLSEWRADLGATVMVDSLMSSKGKELSRKPVFVDFPFSQMQRRHRIQARPVILAVLVYYWTILALLIKHKLLATWIGWFYTGGPVRKEIKEMCQPTNFDLKETHFQTIFQHKWKHSWFPWRIDNKGYWEAAQERGRIDGVQLLWIDRFRAKQASTERDGGQSNKRANWKT